MAIAGAGAGGFEDRLGGVKGGVEGSEPAGAGSDVV